MPGQLTITRSARSHAVNAALIGVAFYFVGGSSPTRMQDAATMAAIATVGNVAYDYATTAGFLAG